MTPRLIRAIAEVSPDDWNRLSGTQTAFTCHAYLQALEDSGCVSAASGWHPSHLIWEDQGRLIGAMPLYRKDHSYGEYVFDWRWAEAFQQTGKPYYPKLLCAIPFTPVPGPRIFAAVGTDPAALITLSLDYLRTLLDAEELSGLYLLFADDQLAGPLANSGLQQRQDIQFVWRNPGYPDFEAFLATLRSSKRKQIRRERKRVVDQSVVIKRLRGSAIDLASMAFFWRCYQETYLKRSGHRGYLNRAFFLSLLESMAEKMLLVLAERDGKPLASALFFVDDQQLSGRYWGSLEDLDFLHFEVCYYQGIEFCIEQGIPMFNPGTQGEHKLVRGFEPLRTHSFHWIADPAFRRAVSRSLAAEKAYIDAYELAALQHLPFRAD